MGSAQNPAYLFKAAVNVDPCSARREEVLTTGGYVLVDVHCRSCNTVLGWQYIAAKSEEQKYKEGATLLQQGLLMRCPAPPMHLMQQQQQHTDTTPINAAGHGSEYDRVYRRRRQQRRGVSDEGVPGNEHAGGANAPADRSRTASLVQSFVSQLQRAAQETPPAAFQLPLAARC